MADCTAARSHSLPALTVFCTEQSNTDPYEILRLRVKKPKRQLT